MKNNKKKIANFLLVFAPCLTYSNLSISDEENLFCSSYALMTQVKNQETYFRSVNLSTGEVVSAFSKKYLPYIKINGMGFNQIDDHYYALDMVQKDLMKITISGGYTTPDDTTDLIDFSLERIDIDGLDPSSKPNLYVADINKDGFWYGFYNPKTLYKIDLNEGSDQYKLVEVGVGNNIVGSLGDMAFNVDSSKIYGVSTGKKGGDARLVEIDPLTGNSIDLGILNIEDPGFFGAVYFDNENNLYAANNKTGNIYKIDLTSVLSGTLPSNAVLLAANGFSAQGNDGARCPTAPLIIEQFDFGHAPKSATLTSFDYAKARFTASNYALAISGASEISTIDATHGEDSNDNGVVLPATLSEDSIETITVHLAGGAFTYLHGWIDFNQDEIFDDSEKILSSVKLTPTGQDILDGNGLDTGVDSDGVHQIQVAIPNNLLTGTTWARFRTSSESLPMSAYGASGAGEVEDYQVTIDSTVHNKTYFPSKEGFATVAFEDKWPLEADYDFNDVVVKYRTENIYVNNYLTRIDIYGQVLTYGAAYNNGFGFELRQAYSSRDEITESHIIKENVVLKINDQEYKESVGSGELLGRKIIDGSGGTAMIRLVEDIKEQLNKPSFENNCIHNDEVFYRSTQECGNLGDDFMFFASIPLNTDVNAGPVIVDTDAPLSFVPFIYSSPNDLRFSDSSWNIAANVKSRGLEVHLKNNNPTDKSYSDQLYGYSADVSSGGNTFLNESGMPWGLLFTHEWFPPRSGLSILTAYPEFEGFVTSSGTENQTWYETHVPEVNGIVSDVPYVDPTL